MSAAIPPDPHPPRRHRRGSDDPKIRDGGPALGYVSWCARCFEWTVERAGTLMLWQVDLVNGEQRWTPHDEHWKNRPPQEPAARRKT